MIGSLRGRIVDRAPRRDQSGEVLVEVGGVGYRVIVPGGALSRWADDAVTEVLLWVHTHVREDAIVLYAFSSRQERDCFEALIGAHGVGPGLALAMLSVHSPAALRQAVATEDLDAFTLVPGIGRKTATRLVVELQSRLGADAASSPAQPGAAASPNGQVLETGQGSAGAIGRSEVRAALHTLGYGPDEIRLALARLPDAGAVEDMVRLALRELAGVRLSAAPR